MNTPYNQDYKRNCSGNEKLTKENTQFEAQLQFVSDAVMAFAHAFRYTHYVKASYISKVKFAYVELMISDIVKFLNVTSVHFFIEP